MILKEVFKWVAFVKPNIYANADTISTAEILMHTTSHTQGNKGVELYN